MSIAEILSPASSGVRSEHVPVVVIGAGQAGLSVGYHLARRGIRFVILDAGERVGDAWRTRWDSLRLFTPSQFDGLDGMPFPAPAGSFPTKDAMAGYLEHYAEKFKLPVRMRTRVNTLMRHWTADISWWRVKIASRPSTWSSPWQITRRRGHRRSPPNSIRKSFNCTRTTIVIARS